MNLVRWDPFTELHGLRQQLGRLLTGPWWRSPFAAEPAGPRMDIYQTDHEVVATAELPGLASRDDIEVLLTENSLTIRGEVKREGEERQEDYYHSERFYGTFSRTVPLPAEVKPEQARATYRNGILEVRVPKKEPGRGNVHRVEIH